MKNMRNKTCPARPRFDAPPRRERSRKIRGTYESPRDSATRGLQANVWRAVRSRKIRGTCDNPRDSAARGPQANVWRATKYKTGFTIVELLIALAISGILLASIAVAINASAINYRENENMFKTVNSTRQALFRMTTQLRTADAVDPNASPNQCSMITADGDDITYQYRSADNTLYLITNSDGQEYLLCENVTAMTFTKNTVIEDAMIKVKSVQITITVQIGNTQRTISSAAVIRRNLY